MYEYIKGKVIAIESNKVIIENNFIGYGIFTSNNSLSKIVPNIEIVIYTYLHVKEDIFQLYGFIDKEELTLFKMLISISGVGPKAALSVLSTLSTKELAVAIATNDDVSIAKAKGVGKKTSQRIILELKDKFKNIEADSDSSLSTKDDNNKLFEEAKMALMVLGYKAKDAKNIIEKVYNEKDTLEDIIRKTLQSIN